MSDFEDNLEFKPLSQGLGFHQKESTPAIDELSLTNRVDIPESFDIDIKPKKLESLDLSQVQKKSVVETQISDEKPTPVWKQNHIKQNSWGGDVDLGLMPMTDGVVEGGLESNSALIDNPFFIPRKTISPVEVVTLRFSGHDGLKKKSFKPILGSFTAILMDVLTLISLCMIAMTLFLGATGSSLSEVLVNLPNDPTGKAQFLSLTMTVGFLYLVLSRCFFGRTIGEWMFHLQMGSNEDQQKSSYPMRVLIRTFFVFATGFILFPLLSWFVKKDILIYFSGLEMHGEEFKS